MKICRLKNGTNSCIGNSLASPQSGLIKIRGSARCEFIDGRLNFSPTHFPPLFDGQLCAQLASGRMRRDRLRQSIVRSYAK